MKFHKPFTLVEKDQGFSQPGIARIMSFFATAGGYEPPASLEARNFVGEGFLRVRIG